MLWMRFASTLPEYVVAYLVATLAWLLFLFLTPKRDLQSGFWFLVSCFWLLIALPFLSGAPSLSTDLHRYLWDGQVSLSGVNPYRYAPEDPALESLRGPGFASMEHREIRSIYPPWAQLLFLGWARLGGAIVLWRLFLLAVYLALIVFLRRNVGWVPAIAFATCPFVLSEGVWNGHLDLVAGALAIASLVLVRKRRALAGALLGIAAGIKLTPIAAAPALARRGGIWFLAAFLAALLVPIAIYGVSGAVMTGFADFATRWSFHSPLYELSLFTVEASGFNESLRALWTAIKDPLRLEAISPWIYAHLYPEFIARAILAIALLVALLLVIRRNHDGAPLDSMGLLLLFSPTIHPWYWLAIVPLALAERSRFWLALALASPFSYLTYVDGFPASLAFALSYGPAAALAIAQAISALRDRDIRRWMAVRGDSPS